MDRVAIAHCIVEPSQHHKAATLGRDEAVGVSVERPRLARRAQRVECRETLVNEEVVGAVHCAGQHQVGIVVMQPIARQLDCIQTAGARRIERHRADTQAKRTFQHERREP